MENNLILSFEKAFNVEILCKNAQMSGSVATAFIRLILALIPTTWVSSEEGVRGVTSPRKYILKKAICFSLYYILLRDN